MLSFTASDPLGAAPPQTSSRADRFAELAFVAFLLLIFVTLRPFAIRDMSLLPLGDSGNGQGDALRQVCYLSVFGAITLAAWRSAGTRILFAVPISLALLLGWCLLSSRWAETPDIVMRRAVLEIVIALCAMLGVQSLGSHRSLTLLRWVLAAILLVNFVSIALVHQAVHLGDETDQQLVGNWRGLYYHKNIAGAVSAITAILYFFQALDTRRRLDWLIFAGAVLFTVMTRSKTSIGLLPLALAAGVAYRSEPRPRLDRLILLTVAALLVTVAGCVLAIEWHAIVRYLSDPTELTGRVAIWQGELAFIRDHPLLGAGFGSFADTGALSPLYNYVSDKWVQGEAHGHNAYLQLFVTIGGIGFFLAMCAFVLQPALNFRKIKQLSQQQFFAPVFAIFVFELMHNFVESDFLEGDGAAWIAFLIIVACASSSAPRAGRTEWQAP